MKKRHFNLWFLFVLSVLFIMLISTILIFFILLALMHMGIDLIFKDRSLFRLILPLVTSTAVGTLLSMMVGTIILKPIRRLNQALSQVSKGNFSIFLNENQNIEELEEMFHNYNLMVKELSSIETLRNDFVTNVSHEFKTPLSNIEGYVTLLQDQNLDQVTKDQYVSIILKNTKQLSSLTSNILKISKLENQTTILDQTTFSLDEQIRQSILLCETKWSEKNITFDLHLDHIMFYGNEELLTQVWVNLIENAIKFSDKNGEIMICASSIGAKETILVSVTDHGIGFDPEISGHLFEKFFQEDKSRQKEGNGLGLALVKQVVALFGGSIYASSNPEDGTCFTVELPINHQE